MSMDLSDAIFAAALIAGAWVVALLVGLLVYAFIP